MDLRAWPVSGDSACDAFGGPLLSRYLLVYQRPPPSRLPRLFFFDS
jgi:hypothetical protein